MERTEKPWEKEGEDMGENEIHEEEEEEINGGLEVRERRREKQAGFVINGNNGGSFKKEEKVEEQSSSHFDSEIVEEESKVEEERSVYFDSEKGEWKCRHCNWTYQSTDPRLKSIPKHEEFCEMPAQVETFSPHQIFFDSPNNKVADSNLHSGGNGTTSAQMLQETLTPEVIIPENGSSAKPESYSSLFETREKGSTSNSVVNINELDLEKILEEQETHDLYCPNCNSCITRRVILKKRKRIARDIKSDLRPEKLPNLGQVETADVNLDEREQTSILFKCLSCFSFFIPTDCCSDIFHLCGGKKESIQIPSTTPKKEEIQNAVAPQTKVENNTTITTNTKEEIVGITTSQTKVENNTTITTNTKEEIVGITTSQTKVENNTTITTNTKEEIVGIATSETKEKVQITVNQQASHQTSEGDNYNWFLGLFQPGGNPKKVSQQGQVGSEPVKVVKERHANKISDESQSFEEQTTDVVASSTVSTLPSASKIIEIKNNETSDAKTNTVNMPDLSYIGKQENPIEVISTVDVRTHIQEVKGPVQVTPRAPAETIIDMPKIRARECFCPGININNWDILKPIVYGGLVELITSLSIVASAASTGASTLNILLLAAANIVGGLTLIIHDLSELKHAQDEADDRNEDELGRYWALLGRKGHFGLHASVAVISYLFFGLLPPLVYAFTFRKTDNSEYKLIAVAASSLVCIAILSLGKAHVRPRRTYFTTMLYYILIGVSASGLSYVAGMLLKQLIESLGLFDQGSSPVPSPPNLIGGTNLRVPSWASF